MYRIATAIAAGMLVAALAAGTSAFGGATPHEASVDAKVAEQIAAHGRDDVLGRSPPAGESDAGTLDAPGPERALRLRHADGDRGPHAAVAQAVPRTRPCAVRVLLDPERDPGDGGRHGSPGACRAPGGGKDHPGRRLQDPTGCPGHPGADPEHRGVGRRPHQRTAGLVDVQRSRREHRRRQRRHRCPLHPRRARREVPRQPRGRQLQPQLQLVGPLSRVRERDAVRQQRPRHAHDGHDGRRRRRSGHEPDRRRPARDVDRGQGLRDQQLLDQRAAVVGPIHGGADRPQRPEPAAEPATRHRQQLVGQRQRGRHLLPGDRPGLGRVRDLPVVRERELGAGLRNASGRPGATPRATRSDRSTSTT